MSQSFHHGKRSRSMYALLYVYERVISDFITIAYFKRKKEE